MRNCKKGSISVGVSVHSQPSQFLSSKMKLLILLVALSGISLGSVDKYTGCLDGIQTAVSYLTFNVTDPSDYYSNLCTNRLLVNSFWAAAKVYCTAEQIAAGSKKYAGYCEEYGGVELIPYSEVLPILTNSYIRSLPLAEYSDIADATVFNTSILISRPFYEAARETSVRTATSTPCSAF
jgi:hypothetical protein